MLTILIFKPCKLIRIILKGGLVKCLPNNLILKPFIIPNVINEKGTI